MAIETIIGLSMLVIAVGGYLIHYTISNINWPLIKFCMRKDV